MYDLVIKDGEVIDVAQGIHKLCDIGISQGKIASLAQKIPPSEAKRVINASGKIVTPGLIDFHTHVTSGIIFDGVEPDEDGVFSGVTTVCDAGSTGHANFEGFKKFVIQQARTDVFCLLSLHSIGQALLTERWNWHSVNPEAILKTIENNSDLIKGIKLRVVGEVAETLGIELIKTGKKIAREAGVPIMLHLGKDPVEKTSVEKMDSLTRELLPLLDKGDIISHIYTPNPGNAIKPDGTVFPEFKEAIQRGIVTDLGMAVINLSFEIARKAMAQGIFPTILSTDISTFSPYLGLVLTNLMSKFLALGVSLDRVIEMTTINPARALSEEKRRGSLKAGMPADISILELTKGEFPFVDSLGETITGDTLIIPKLTLKSGVEIPTKSPSDVRENLAAVWNT